ncbi:MAG: type II toxin-antitoxin system RelE/ParE family toxin [Thermodesulfovibrionales bacterium]
MIKDIRHKGLNKLYECGHTKGVKIEHVERLRKILALLETAETVDDMDLPGLKLHELKGKRKETYAVSVSGNWRITFRFQNGDVSEVDYEDYH